MELIMPWKSMLTLGSRHCAECRAKLPRNSKGPFLISRIRDIAALALFASSKINKTHRTLMS